MNPRRTTAGFTAVEATVMAVVLALISCVAVISANSLQQSALVRKATADLFKINMSKMAWMMDHPGQDLPANEADRQSALVGNPAPASGSSSPSAGHYLKYGMPVCPYNGNYSIGSVYEKPSCSLNGVSMNAR